MLLLRTLLLAVLFAGLPAPASGSPVATSTAGFDRVATGAGRAMWVWTRPAPRRLVRFADRHGVRDLFLHVPPELDRSPDRRWVRRVAEAARPSGLRLHALGGDPGWTTDTAAAVAWQRDVLTTGLFRSVHVDIEPWGRADWATDQDRLVAGYLRTLRALEREGGDSRLEADLPFWFHQLRTRDRVPVDEAVLGIVDRVTVMTYRTKVTGSDSVVRLGRPTLRTGARAGKPVRLAVETNHLGDDPVSEKQTFFGHDPEELAAALRRVDRVVGHVRSYAGVAIHDLDGWRGLEGASR